MNDLEQLEHELEAEAARTRLLKLVTNLVCALVDNEIAVVIDLIPETMHTNLKLTVAPEDFGKAVGKGGQNAEALRTIIAAVGRKLGLPACTLFIIDPQPSMRGKGQYKLAQY